MKLCLVLVVMACATNTFGGELGLKMANFNYKPEAVSAKGGGGGGIDKGLIQFDIGFTIGGHGAVAGPAKSAAIGALPGVMFNVDVAVHKYASVGGYFGIYGGKYGASYYYGFSNKVIGIGIGARGVFHIYQLIADKTNTKVSADNLDFYFPMHIGGIIAIGRNGGGTSGGFQIGGGLGVRYYFTDMLGVMSEVGWLETSVWKVGLALKF
jgi:hypothetical protein